MNKLNISFQSEFNDSKIKLDTTYLEDIFDRDTFLFNVYTTDLIQIFSRGLDLTGMVPDK